MRKRGGSTTTTGVAGGVAPPSAAGTPSNANTPVAASAFDVPETFTMFSSTDKDKGKNTSVPTLNIRRSFSTVLAQRELPIRTMTSSAQKGEDLVHNVQSTGGDSDGGQQKTVARRRMPLLINVLDDADLRKTRKI